MRNLINEIFLLESVLTDDMIIDAITNKRVIEISYRGAKEKSAGVREIEPAAFGEDKHGRKVIRAWQRSGASVTGIDPTAPPPLVTRGWKWFLVDNISSWNDSSNANYTKARPKYNHLGDKHMRKIYAIADFGKVIIRKPKPTAVQRFDRSKPTRNPDAVVKDFGKFDTSKNRYIAVSPEVDKEYERDLRKTFKQGTIFQALIRIGTKMASDNTTTYIDISDMTPDEVKKFSVTRIKPGKALRECFEHYDAGYPIITRFKTLKELLNG